MEPVLFYRSYGYIEGRQEGQEILILFFLLSSNRYRPASPFF